MFSNISSINFNTNQSATSASSKVTTFENTSIFGDSIVKDEKVKLTKEEKMQSKLLKKQSENVLKILLMELFKAESKVLVRVIAGY